MNLYHAAFLVCSFPNISLVRIVIWIWNCWNVPISWRRNWISSTMLPAMPKKIRNLKMDSSKLESYCTRQYHNWRFLLIYAHKTARRLIMFWICCMATPYQLQHNHIQPHNTLFPLALDQWAIPLFLFLLFWIALVFTFETNSWHMLSSIVCVTASQWQRDTRAARAHSLSKTKALCVNCHKPITKHTSACITL